MGFEKGKDWIGRKLLTKKGWISHILVLVLCPYENMLPKLFIQTY